MIFKRHCGIAPGVFDREIENRGGMSNAATSHDYATTFSRGNTYLEDTLLGGTALNAAIPEDGPGT